MSYYGITKISWDKSKSFVKQVVLHKMMHVNTGNLSFDLDVGVKMHCNEVASLIDKGNHVFVMLKDDQGCYKPADTVGVMPGYQEEHLESLDETGNPTGSLFDLPAWTEN